MIDAILLRVPLPLDARPPEVDALVSETAYFFESPKTRSRPIIRAQWELYPNKSATGFLRLRSNGFDLGSLWALKGHVEALGLSSNDVGVQQVECCLDLAAETVAMQNGLRLAKARTAQMFTEERIRVRDYIQRSRSARTVYQGSKKTVQLKIYSLSFRGDSPLLGDATRVELLVKPTMDEGRKVTLDTFHEWALNCRAFDRLEWLTPPRVQEGPVTKRDLLALGVREIAKMHDRPLPIAMRHSGLWNVDAHIEEIMRPMRTRVPLIERCFQKSAERFFTMQSATPLGTLVFDLDGNLDREIPHDVLRPLRGAAKSVLRSATSESCGGRP